MTGADLRKLIESSDKSYADVARHLGVIPQNLNSKLKAKKLDFEFVRKVTDFIGADIVKEPETAYGNASPYMKSNGRKNLIVVPLKAFGGFLAGYKNKVYIDSLEHHSFPWIHGECYAFEIEGFSMYKTKLIDGEIFEVGYKPGSFVVATPLEKFEGLMKGRDYVFQTTDGIIVKRFKGLKDDHCQLESINEEYNPVKPLHLKSIKRMYYVEQNIKKP